MKTENQIRSEIFKIQQEFQELPPNDPRIKPLRKKALNQIAFLNECLKQGILTKWDETQIEIDRITSKLKIDKSVSNYFKEYKGRPGESPGVRQRAFIEYMGLAKVREFIKVCDYLLTD